MVRNHKTHRGRGLALTEMALVLPLLLWLTLGAIEYGWIFLKMQQVTGASREGARVGATPDAVGADVTNAVNDVMTAANISGHSTTVAPGVGIATGATLTVTVTVPYTNVQLIATPFLPTPTNLTASTSMAKEGP